jgi:hypothetical protein
MKGGANDQLANAQFAAWFGVSTELVVSLGHGTHMARATLAFSLSRNNRVSTNALKGSVDAGGGNLGPDRAMEA